MKNDVELMFRELASDEKNFTTTDELQTMLELQRNATGSSSNNQETNNLKRTLNNARKVDARRVEVFSIRTEKKIIPGRQVVIYVSTVAIGLLYFYQ